MKKAALLTHYCAQFCALLSVFLLITVLPPMSSAAEVSCPTLWEAGVIPQNSTLAQSLAGRGLSAQGIHLITSLLARHVDMRRIRPNSAFRFSLDRYGKVQEFLLELDGITICQITKDPLGRYKVSKRAWKRRLEPSRISGAVSTTLEEALEGAGEAKGLAALFREILADHVELCPDIQQGDRFKLIVDKIFAEDKLLRYGEIPAFEIRKRNTVVRAFRYEGNYYDEKGNSLSQQFLRVPLDYHFVSSEFMKSRRHPILGGLRPHHGIDFAAPFGTPVWAVANGEVVSCGWRGGYGFAVQLKHRHGYETLYAHLQRNGCGIREGTKVEKKQIIGHIGATGLSTGAHLHYSLVRNGKDRNPLLEHFPRETITGTAAWKAFLEKKRTMLNLLGDRGSFKWEHFGNGEEP